MNLKAFILAVLIWMILIVGTVAVFGDEPILDHPTTVQGILEELNSDPIIVYQLGFYFECKNPEASKPILVLLTGKTTAQLESKWKQFGQWLPLVSNNWKIVTGSGLVVCLDTERRIIFATDDSSAFHMSRKPKPKPPPDPNRRPDNRAMDI